MSAMRTRLPVSGCLLLSVVCLSSVSYAQTAWQKTYGGTGRDEGNSVQQTADGGYIIAGFSTQPSGPPYDSVYLVKTNAQGDTLWTRIYGGTRGMCVQQTADGGYVIACHGYGIDLIKTDAYGDTLWTTAFGRKDPHWSYSVQQTTDGGFIVSGTISRNLDTYVYLVKTGAQGDSLWARIYGGPGNNGGRSVQQTTDGGYIITGQTNSFDSLLRNCVYLIKTDTRGDTTWTRSYNVGGTWEDRGNSVQQTADGGYVTTGHTWTSEGNGQVYLIRSNAQGETLWTRTYGGAYDEEGCSVRQTTDGGFVVAGHTGSFGADTIPNFYDFYLVKTDAQGDTHWTRTYGGIGYDEAYSVQQTTDGDYVIAGRTQCLGAGDYDVYLIKTNGTLDVGPVAIQSPPGVVDSGISYVPRVVVRNFGLTSGSIVQVTMNIGSGYSQTVRETLVSVPLDTLVFPPWTAEPVGSTSITCFTSLPGDWDPTNDTIQDSIQVLGSPAHDVGAVAILSPSGSVRAGDTVIPQAIVRNFGNRQERYFDVRFRIGTSYNEKVNVADALLPDSTAELTFPGWVAEAGDWAVSCSTMLGSDENRDNDKVSSSVQVTDQTLAIEPDRSDRVEAGKSKSYSFYALIQGGTGGVVEVARPSPPPGWSAALRNAAGTQDLTDTDEDRIPDLGYVAPGESSWFSLEVTAPSGTQGDTASLSQVTIPVAGQVGGRSDIADTAMLTLTLVPELSIHNFPNPFTDHTAFVVGLPEDGKASLTVYTRAGERVCRVLENSDLPAGVHVERWDAVNDNGRRVAPGTYEYLLDYVHQGKTDRVRKKLVVSPNPK